jgi:hypothetical protein
MEFKEGVIQLDEQIACFYHELSSLKDEDFREYDKNKWREVIDGGFRYLTHLIQSDFDRGVDIDNQVAQLSELAILMAKDWTFPNREHVFHHPFVAVGCTDLFFQVLQMMKNLNDSIHLKIENHVLSNAIITLSLEGVSRYAYYIEAGGLIHPMGGYSCSEEDFEIIKPKLRNWVEVAIDGSEFANQIGEGFLQADLLLKSCMLANSFRQPWVLEELCDVKNMVQYLDTCNNILLSKKDERQGNNFYRMLLHNCRFQRGVFQTNYGVFSDEPSWSNETMKYMVNNSERGSWEFSGDPYFLADI